MDDRRSMRRICSRRRLTCFFSAANAANADASATIRQSVCKSLDAATANDASDATRPDADGADGPNGDDAPVAANADAY